MRAYGYDFHQTMIAKIEAAQRPLRVRELADFAALYGVDVQELLHPRTSTLRETDEEIAEVTARRDMAQRTAAEARHQLEAIRKAMRDAEQTHQMATAEAAVLEGRLAALQAERQKLITLWAPGEHPGLAEGKAGSDTIRKPGASIASTAGGPTVLRILLGAQLRRLREAKQTPPEDAGQAIRASATKITRMETGRVGFKERDIADLLTLYGVTDEEEQDTLLDLARRANAPGWWHDYNDVLPHWFEAYVALEEVATQIREYEVQFIPGLLQTEDYARAVTLLSHDAASAREIERRVRLRMQRQALLDRDEPPNYWAVIDEAALRRPAGSPATMRGQLKHLADMAHRPNVTIQIIPFQIGGDPAAGGPFTILRFAEPDLPDVVYLEQLTSALYLDKPEAVDSYLRVMERLGTRTLTPRETTQFLKQLLK
jgi:transcriptional regulator with XRE-family HTH domain